jgi:hypothetical protein
MELAVDGVGVYTNPDTVAFPVPLLFAPETLIDGNIAVADLTLLLSTGISNAANEFMVVDVPNVVELLPVVEFTCGSIGIMPVDRVGTVMLGTCVENVAEVAVRVFVDVPVTVSVSNEFATATPFVPRVVDVGAKK